jgi:chemotaxis signal transduction protein
MSHSPGDNPMIPAHIGTSKRDRTAGGEQVLLFVVGSQIFAITTEAVQEIRSTDSLAGTADEIENSPISWVRHKIKHGHRTYYVVNAASQFQLPITRPTLLLIMRHSRTALLIDRIERMTEISRVYPLPRAFRGDERRWYRGLAYADDRILPVIEPTALLSTENIGILDDSLKSTLPQDALEGIRS